LQDEQLFCLCFLCIWSSFQRLLQVIAVPANAPKEHLRDGYGRTSYGLDAFAVATWCHSIEGIPIKMLVDEIIECQPRESVQNFNQFAKI